MRVILVRHGETGANRERLALGRGDPPLSRLGGRQALAVAAAISGRPAGRPIAAVYSSPLLRAFDTAATIARELGGLAVETVEELAEMDVGDMEGLTSSEMRERFPEFLRLWFTPEAGEIRMPGSGESLLDVQARAWEAIERIRDAHEPDATVVAVSHNFALHAIVCRALSIPLADFRRFQQDLASMTTLEFRGPRTLLTQLNEVCHLDGLHGGPDWGEARH